MTTFTKEERLLMMLYSPGNLPGLIAILQEMRAYLMPDEKDLLAMTDSVLSRLFRLAVRSSRKASSRFSESNCRISS